MKNRNRPPLFDIRLLAALFLSFLRIGPATFGGGYAVVPLIEREVVGKRKWLEGRDLADMLAIAGAAPGAMGINSAMLIGYRVAGAAGAVSALLGILLPTFLIVLGLFVFFLHVQDHPKVQAAFVSIRATIVALIVYACYKIGRTALVDAATWLIAGAAVLALLLAGWSPFVVILGGGAAGLVYASVLRKLGRFKPEWPQSKAEAQSAPSEYVYPDYFIGSGI